MLRTSTSAKTLPVSLKQKFMLDQTTHPDCPDDLRDRWILSHSILVRPKVDVRRFRRAVEKVSKRHDSLRLQFEPYGDTWQAVIHSPEQNFVREINLGDVDDDTFHATVSQIVKAPLPLVGSPLTEINIVRCGKRGDALITRMHHAITDGYGIIVFVEDLIKYLIGVPILGAAVTYEEYVIRYQSPLSSQRRKIEEFWEKMHADFPIAPHVGRKAKGLAPLVDCIGPTDQRTQEFIATRQSLSRLEARAAKLKMSVGTLICGAYLEQICQTYDLDKIMFITHIARTDPALATYMGDHTLDCVLPYHASADSDLAVAAKSYRDTVMTTLEHLPADKARRGTPYEKELFARGCYPSQFCVRSPRTLLRENKSMFREGFKMKNGDQQKLGPFTIVALEVPWDQRILSELQMNMGSSDVRTGFSFQYDGFAYAQDEIMTLGEKTFEHLGLDLAGTVAS